MEKWFFWKKTSSNLNKDDVNIGEKKTESFTEKTNHLLQTDTRDENYIADPVVEEFFKDFPSPYREKVVQHYSKREGFLFFDWYRNRAMIDERRLAAEGIFLEDQREFKKLTELNNPKTDMKNEIQDARELMEWEKKLLPYVPIQNGDTVMNKLIKTANLSLIGACALWIGISNKKQLSKPIFYRYLFISGCIFVGSQYLAVQRFLDQGVFDKSTDERDIVTKSMDELVETAHIVQDFIFKNVLEDSSKKKSR